MTRVVRCKHDLLPESGEKDRRGEVPSVAKEEEECDKESNVSDRFASVISVMTSVETALFNTAVKRIVFLGDGVLGKSVRGRVSSETFVDFELHRVEDPLVAGGELGDGFG